MSQSIVTPRTSSSPGLGSSFDPRNPSQYDYEEFYPDDEKYELSGKDYIVFGVRILTLLLCLVSLILILVNIARGYRLKSWRLYSAAGLTTLAWIIMTLYHDCIDNFFLRFFSKDPQSLSIFWCFSNLLHGLSIYLIILLLAHLSDMQHRSHWLLLIATVLLIPLVYSVGILITDLRVDPTIRFSWQCTVAIDSVRVFLYNIISTILLIVMSRSFCTRTLYGTYSEQRATSVVIVARWTYALLFLHNLVAMAAYAVKVVTKVPSDLDLELFIFSGNVMDEVALALIVLSVPFSYVVGMLAQCCCGVSRETNMEMDKVDKIYTDVWTTPSARSAAAPPMTSTTNPPNHHSGLQNGVVARRPQSSREQQGSNSTLNSIDSIGQLPRIATNPTGQNSSNRHNKRVRESYMEAVSMGSLDETGSLSSSRSTEPIDL